MWYGALFWQLQEPKHQSSVVPGNQMAGRLAAPRQADAESEVMRSSVMC